MPLKTGQGPPTAPGDAIGEVPPPELRLERGVPLAGLTSVRFGGPAEHLARPAGVGEIGVLLRWARRRGMPVRVMGRGTNLFVHDAGVAGLVMLIGPGAMNGVQVDGRRVVAGAGAPLSRLVEAALENGLAGLEPLVGIPGSVGGAIGMNAGTRDGDIAATVTAVAAIDRAGEVVRFDRRRMAFGYRASSPEVAVIVEAEFDLEPADRRDLRRRADDLRQRRKVRMPTGVPSAGCVFKNPPGAAAGRLIDRAGCKGRRAGAMEVSRQHANFFVNRGGATFDDARRLIDLVRDAVARTFDVELELEVEIWQNGGPRAGILSLQTMEKSRAPAPVQIK